MKKTTLIMQLVVISLIVIVSSLSWAAEPVRIEC